MRKIHHISGTRLIALSFVLVIVSGAILLMLPVSSRTGTMTNPVNSFFTATSATCVTGLVAYDTFSHWSLFGQIVILALIQIGGLGFMTVISMFAILTKKHLSLHERQILMKSAGSVEYAGLLSMIKKILIGTFLVEILGASLLSIRFVPQMGIRRGIYNAVFHSISAFCNAGFDLMGRKSPFSSFTAYQGDVLVNLTLIALIVIGGIGFLVWDDILKKGIHLRKYELHSKVVLTCTAVLILTGGIVFYFTEANASMAAMPQGKRILASLFQSVTTRTAGFNTVDQGILSNSGSVMTMVLMFIGGSPGSTAGGVKTTTFLVVLISALFNARDNSDIHMYKRRLEKDLVRQATSVVTIYLCAVLLVSAIIAAIEPFSLTQIFYEVISAVGTVGLSTGITQSLHTASRILIMLLMYFGRIGGMSMVMIFAERKEAVPMNRPTEKIMIG